MYSVAFFFWHSIRAICVCCVCYSLKKFRPYFHRKHLFLAYNNLQNRQNSSIVCVAMHRLRRIFHVKHLFMCQILRKTFTWKTFVSFIFGREVQQPHAFFMIILKIHHFFFFAFVSSPLTLLLSELSLPQTVRIRPNSGIKCKCANNN